MFAQHPDGVAIGYAHYLAGEICERMQRQNGSNIDKGLYHDSQ
jgi:hypothetical protein